jgi:hypothetical protein
MQLYYFYKNSINNDTYKNLPIYYKIILTKIKKINNTETNNLCVSVIKNIIKQTPIVILFDIINSRTNLNIIKKIPLINSEELPMPTNYEFTNYQYQKYKNHINVIYNDINNIEKISL